MNEASDYHHILRQLNPELQQRREVTRLTIRMNEVERIFGWFRSALEGIKDPHNDLKLREYLRQENELIQQIVALNKTIETSKADELSTKKLKAERQQLISRFSCLNTEKCDYTRYRKSLRNQSFRDTRLARLTDQRDRLTNQLADVAEDLLAEQDYAKSTNSTPLATFA